MRLSKIKKLIHELPAPVSEAWLADARLEFLQSIRNTAAASVPRNPRRLPSLFSLLPARLTAALLAMLILFGGSGAVVFAAQGTVPGEALYPVKRASERALLAVAASAETKVDVRARIAERRLQEAEKLMARKSERKNQDAALSVLAEFNENLDAATRELPKARMGAGERAMNRLDQALLRHQAILLRLEANELQPEARAAVRQAIRAREILHDIADSNRDGGDEAQDSDGEETGAASGAARISEKGPRTRPKVRGDAESVLGGESGVEDD
ncbi:MAG: DUF5667 domain-containing protein [Patescibacteria group bacterium]